MYQHVKVPTGGAKITLNKDFSLNVPDNPIIPYIEGDGTGVDITPVMIKVVDAAVAKAYGGKRKIHWMEIYAGEKATKVYGPDVWLPEETLSIVKDYVVSIKGPLTTPVGGGIRSLNVALRQELDLYVCLRPGALVQGRALAGEASRERRHGDLPRELGGHLRGHRMGRRIAEAKKVIDFLVKEMGVKKIRFPLTSASASSPCRAKARSGSSGARTSTRSTTTAARSRSCTRATSRSSPKARSATGATRSPSASSAPKLLDGGPWMSFKIPKSGKDIVVKDVITDAMLQQILLRPASTTSSPRSTSTAITSPTRSPPKWAASASRRARISRTRSQLRGDARHRAEVRRQGLRQPGLGDPVAEMMLVHMGWREAAKVVTDSLEKAIGDKVVTYDFARLMEGRQAGVLLRVWRCDDRTDVTAESFATGLALRRLCRRSRARSHDTFGRIEVFGGFGRPGRRPHGNGWRRALRRFSPRSPPSTL
jgi:isocitrate dehydrogenase